MNSAIAKVTKGHSALSSKHRTKKSKKAAPKKQAVRTAKSKKPNLKKTSAGQARPRKSLVTKKGSAKAKAVQPAPSRKSADRRTPNKAAAPKAVPSPAKRPLAPETVAAVRAFEQALKVFNRHDFEAAKTAFDSLLERFGDQTEVAAGVRTYLAICEQRLMRMPSVPRTAEALYDRGVLEYNKGNAENAISLFEKALKSEPRADHIMYSLAAAYASTSNIPKTLDYLRRAISIRPVHRSHARRDPDFNNLHLNLDFQELVGLGLDLE
jgi:tetratricopeptide (TPR) repeat protein